MKLKKIASLMLAGIMAVSMLAGCKSGSNNGGANQTPDEPVSPSSNFTAEVLAEANPVTQLVLKADTNTKLDQAVVYAAANHVGSKPGEVLTYVKDGGDYQTLAEKYMTGNDVSYATNANDIVPSVQYFTNEGEDGTIYVLYRVDRTVTDKWIASEIADLLDTWVPDFEMSDDNNTYAYSVSVAKADSLAGDKAVRADDIVLVGVAISVDYTSVNY